MNIVGKLTLRHMLLNKKRTTVTIIGIIISVAMIMAVSTIAYSFTSYMGENAMMKTGQFHVVFEKVPYENRDIVLEGSNIDESFYSKVLGDFSIDSDNDNDIKNVVRIIGLRSQDFDKIYFSNLDGDYPENENQVMVSDWYGSSLGANEVGDVIQIGGKEYTVSGIYYNMDFETKSIDIEGQFTYALYTYWDGEEIGNGEYINIYSKLFDLGGNIYDDIRSIGEESNCEAYYDNKDVLYYYGISEGNFGSLMNSVKYILISVIMVGAISLITNGFSISLSERSKHLGMLASVGATKTQKRFSVFFEGFIVGIISIPLGILGGYIGTVITFKVIEDKIYTIIGDGASKINVDVKPWVIILAVAFSVVTIFFSAYFPARRASKIGPIDAIRQTKDIKISEKQVRTSRLTRKIFGFEGELALKNLKRNRKKYAVTVFSLVISIILFLTVYSFVYYLTQSADMVYDSNNYDMSGSIYGVNQETEDKLRNQLRRNDTVGDIAFVANFTGATMEMPDLEADKFISDAYKSYHRESEEIYEREDVAYNIYPTLYDGEYLKKYLESRGISYEEFIADKNNVIVLNYFSGRLYAEEAPKFYDFTYTKYKKGDEIKGILKAYVDKESSDASYEYVDEISYNVFDVIDDGEMPLGYFSGNDVIPIIVTQELYEELINKIHEKSNTALDKEINSVSSNEFSNQYFYINGGDVESQYDSVMKTMDDNNVSAWANSSYESRKSSEDMLFLIQVFTYGFVVLMTLVCAANIFNTISTSIALRKREFVTLRSVGMTKKSFDKMIFYESGFYGLKALMYGMPVSLIIILANYFNFSSQFDSGFSLPLTGIFIVIVTVFIVIGSSMVYAASKIKKENIIDGLKEENI